MTQGIVSALARTQIGASDYGFFIQTDAAINPGNSGGALVDLDGRLVGINSMIYSRSGGSMGLGFAIPVNMVKGVVAAALHGGNSVKRPWLGATLQNVSKDIAETLGLDRPTGAMVVEVVEASPAAAAGLKRGDVIAAIDSQVVDDAESVGFRLGVKPLGGTARLAVLRDGKTLDLPLKLASAPETPARDALTIQGRSPFEGALVMNLSPAVVGGIVARRRASGRGRRLGRGKLDRRPGRRAEGRHRGRGERNAHRDDPRPRARLLGACTMVGSDHPPGRRNDPHPARGLRRQDARFRSALPETARVGGTLERTLTVYAARGVSGSRPEGTGAAGRGQNHPSLKGGDAFLSRRLTPRRRSRRKTFGLDGSQSPSSGAIPFGLPSAESVIFSIRISAFRRSSSQRAFNASPRS